MKFDLKLAQEGGTVEIFSFKFGVWCELPQNHHYVGYDNSGKYVIVQNDTIGLSFLTYLASDLRMKPKSRTHWFRTWMFPNGEIRVFNSDNSEGFSWVEKDYGTGKWIEEPWSKEIPEYEHI